MCAREAMVGLTFDPPSILLVAPSIDAHSPSEGNARYAPFIHSSIHPHAIYLDRVLVVGNNSPVFACASLETLSAMRSVCVCVCRDKQHIYDNIVYVHYVHRGINALLRYTCYVHNMFIFSSL
jgi:hypothetical protein